MGAARLEPVGRDRVKAAPTSLTGAYALGSACNAQQNHAAPLQLDSVSDFHYCNYTRKASKGGSSWAARSIRRRSAPILCFWTKCSHWDLTLFSPSSFGSFVALLQHDNREEPWIQPQPTFPCKFMLKKEVYGEVLCSLSWNAAILAWGRSEGGQCWAGGAPSAENHEVHGDKVTCPAPFSFPHHPQEDFIWWAPPQSKTNWRKNVDLTNPLHQKLSKKKQVVNVDQFWTYKRIGSVTLSTSSLQSSPKSRAHPKAEHTHSYIHAAEINEKRFPTPLISL